MGYPPVRLHRLVPELTHRMVEKIFATHLEDWPAMLRALRETGDEFRLGKIASLPKSSAAPAFEEVLSTDGILNKPGPGKPGRIEE